MMTIFIVLGYLQAKFTGLIKLIGEINPSYIISCLRGDFEEQLVFHKVLASYLRNTNLNLIFCSTANVFDKDRSKPHLECLEPNPVSEYGKYKYKCERMLRKIIPNNIIIVRLPQIWSKQYGRIPEILHYVQRGEKMLVYENIYLNINSDLRVAKQIKDIINTNEKGIFHLGSKDFISHKDLYETMINRLGLRIDKILDNVSDGSEKLYFDVTTSREKYKFYISEILSDIFDE